VISAAPAQVRLLHRRCSPADTPVMLSLGPGRRAEFGRPGPPPPPGAPPGAARQYELDRPAPRNTERDRAAAERLELSRAGPAAAADLRFHPRLRAAALVLAADRRSLSMGVGISAAPVNGGVAPAAGEAWPAAIAGPLPAEPRVEWRIRLGRIALAAGGPGAAGVGGVLTAPRVRVGVVRRGAVGRLLAAAAGGLGADGDSWAVECGDRSVLLLHGGDGGSSGEAQRVAGVRLGSGDAVVLRLDAARGTLALAVGGSGGEDPLPPFEGVWGAVLPAVCVCADTAVSSITIEACGAW
jgi:hypothetical protein